MEIYTIQMSQWRLCEPLGIKFIDTTFKKETAFSPTKEMVHGYKYGSVSQEEYSERYNAILNQTQETNPEEWEALFEYAKVAIACMCRPGVFCHRHLCVAKVLTYAQERGHHCVYMGEI
jgi:uncharacterized protein YeaO (DUF488 family)